MSHGINDNVVHRWRHLAREGKLTTPKPSEFIALPMPVAPVSSPTPANITLKLRRGAITMMMTWPSSAVADFALWTRELLR